MADAGAVGAAAGVAPGFTSAAGVAADGSASPRLHPLITGEADMSNVAASANDSVPPLRLLLKSYPA